ncbi:DUF4157 domain-containing protein [Massilia sp. P8910]|uniref:eCIS core domain-containing protein n=1 Tax=Massilia antarctica TaxID=2765360 RepID=UPI001E2FF46D|nr:DUF4157 domain-containing protein [Massilia antarctica]MCE3602229.1 DUF4157 domain-containing protein [Massilia antarctica]
MKSLIRQTARHSHAGNSAAALHDRGGGSSVNIVDNRAVAVAQRRLQACIADSPRMQEQHAQMARMGAPVAQRRSDGGLPAQLQSGIEHLSGQPMDDVRVHYNSNRPAQLHALAYAQGSDIHLATGQERHLPHEAWHVVQQKQGRVRPSFQLMGASVNDDLSLEREADVMGAMAASAQLPTVQRQPGALVGQQVRMDGQRARLAPMRGSAPHSAPLQMITGWGVLGGLGAAAVGLGLGAGALAATALGVGAGAGMAVAAGGLGLLGAAVGGGLRRATANTASAAPQTTPGLTLTQRGDLDTLRIQQNIQPLDVHWDAALTDEVAGRRREPDSYLQWQPGAPGPDGQISDAAGTPLAPGRYIYVVTVQNEFRYLPMKAMGKDHFDQYRTHSQLSGKQKVFAAGAFTVGETSHVTSVDNESGHYQPPHLGHAQYAAELLGAMGFKGGIVARDHNHSGDPKGMAYAKSQVKANLRALKTWIPGTKKAGWEFGFPDIDDPAMKAKMPF